MKQFSLLLPFILASFGLSAQNVGIGTALPTQKLEVSENGTVIVRVSSADNGSPGLDLYRPGTLNRDWRLLNDGGTFLRVQHSLDLGVSAATDLMVLNGTGSEVTVNGKAITTQFQMTNGATSNFVMTSDGVGNGTWQNVNSLITNDGDWTVTGANLHNTALGFVGIRTPTPNRPLTIQASGTEVVTFRDNAGADLWHLNLNFNGMNFAESGIADYRLFLAQGGNVGIGTNTPTQKLDVAGFNEVSARVTSLNSGNPALDLFRPGTGSRDWRILNNLGTYLRIQHSLDLDNVAPVDLAVFNPGGIDLTGYFTATSTIRSNDAYYSDGNVVIDNDGGWHRSYGNTGWYNGTHGGGWYMTGTTWVEAYNNKAVYSASVIRGDGGLQVGGGGNRFNVQSNGVTDWLPGNAAVSMRINNVWDGNWNQPGIFPNSNNWGYVGLSGNRWYRMYAEDVYTWNGFLWIIYDTYDDIELLNSIEADTLWDPVLKHHVMKIRPSSIPKVITDYDSDDYDPSNPNISQKRMNGFLMGTARQLDREGKVRDQRLEARTEMLAEAIGMDFGQGKADKTIFDRGKAKAPGSEIRVRFSDEFSAELKGTEATVNITPRSLYTTYYVSEVTANGFTLIVNSDKAEFEFNWLAVADVPTAVKTNVDHVEDVFHKTPVKIEGDYPAIDYEAIKEARRIRMEQSLDSNSFLPEKTVLPEPGKGTGTPPAPSPERE